MRSAERNEDRAGAQKFQAHFPVAMSQRTPTHARKGKATGSGAPDHPQDREAPLTNTRSAEWSVPTPLRCMHSVTLSSRLEQHGFKARKLDLRHWLPAIGFRHCDGS